MKRFVVASVLWFLWLTTCSVYGEKGIFFTIYAIVIWNLTLFSIQFSFENTFR